MTAIPYRAMAASLRGYWDEAEGYQRVCYVVGTILIAVGLLHALAFVLVGGAWVGPVSWRKPATFGVSFGLTTLTLGWIAGFLRLGRAAWPLLGTLAVANTIEVIWVSLQRARGVPSHFNDETAFDGALFLLNGVVIAFTVTIILILTLRSFRVAEASPSMRLAIRTGLVVLNLSMAAGIAMIVNGTMLVEGSDAALTTFGSAGIMKVPHAVGMHAIQVLPGLAWLLSFSALPEERRTGVVGLAATGYGGLVLVSALQTYTGRAPWDLDILSGVLLLASLAALGLALLRTLGAIVRSDTVPA
jgi:hypothetical protein